MKRFFKEKTISKLIFSFAMLAIFASIFGPSVYTQFTEKILFVFAAEVGYGGGGGVDGIFQCSTSNVTEANGPAFTSLIGDQIVLLGGTLNFSIQTVNLKSPTYALSDSFAGTSISNNNINSSGDFIWTPIESDTGIHNIEVIASDNCGFIISTTFKVIVYQIPDLDEYINTDQNPEDVINTPSINTPNKNNPFVPKLPNAGVIPSINDTKK